VEFLSSILLKVILLAGLTRIMHCLFEYFMSACGSAMAKLSLYLKPVGYSFSREIKNSLYPFFTRLFFKAYSATSLNSSCYVVAELCRVMISTNCLFQLLIKNWIYLNIANRAEYGISTYQKFKVKFFEFTVCISC